MNRFYKSQYFFYLSITLIYLSHSIVYKFYIGHLFGYQGFITNFDSSKNIFNIVIILFLFFISEKFIKNSFIKKLASDLLLFFILIPTLVLWTYNSISNIYILVVIFVYLFFLLLMKIKINLSGIKTNINPNKLVNIFKWISFLTLLSLIFSQGITKFNYDFNDLYDFRSTRTTLPVIVEFFIAFSTQLLLPIILLLSFIEKKIIIILFIFLFYIVFFLYTNQKTFIFTPILLLILFYFIKIKINRIVYAITLVVSILSFLEIVVLYNQFEVPPLFSESTIRRLFFIPNLVNDHYLEYFSKAAFYYWSDSKITFGLLDVPTINMSHAIGSYYYNADSNANTGFIGSGYGHFGFFGILIYTLIFSLTIILIEAIADKFSNYTLISLFFMPFFALITSSDLPSIYFSNGLGTSIIFLFFFKKQLNIKRL